MATCLFNYHICVLWWADVFNQAAQTAFVRSFVCSAIHKVIAIRSMYLEFKYNICVVKTAQYNCSVLSFFFFFPLMIPFTRSDWICHFCMGKSCGLSQRTHAKNRALHMRRVQKAVRMSSMKYPARAWIHFLKLTIMTGTKWMTLWQERGEKKQF